MYTNKTIVVFGGTGSIGSEIVEQILSYHDPKIIRVFSNDENSLWELETKFKPHHKKLRFLLGDVRNLERVKFALAGADIVFNASAIKHVPYAEYNPIEAVMVNIIGLENIIKGCFEHGIDKLIQISTDKAINPVSVMGATKMIGERVCISRELAKGDFKTKISCVRFGNVLGSRGSIIPLIKKQIEDTKTITITDRKMTRFFMSVQQAVSLVLKAGEIASGGEIFVLKMPIFKIIDLMEIIIEEYCKMNNEDPSTVTIIEIGKRFGEKLHEKLLFENEYERCYGLYNLYYINYDKDNKKESRLIVPSEIEQKPLEKEAVRDLLQKWKII